MNPIIPLHRPIALLTDFGTKDWYVGAMKGEILKRSPKSPIIEISHEIEPGNIEQGAFVLGCVVDSMPSGTVLCCVIDPGVGTERETICGKIGKLFYVGPDNGLATVLVRRTTRAERQLFRIENPEFHGGRQSATFHGRDIFAPAAGCIARGDDPAWAGDRVKKPLTLSMPQARVLAGGIAGRVMWVDRFGNLITNIERKEWEKRFKDKFTLRVGTLALDRVLLTYAETEPGKALAYWGSAGVLEIGVNGGSAAQAGVANTSDPVTVKWGAKL